MDQAPELVTEVVGGLGRITLNRPRALNALSFEMCRGFDAALEAWAKDDRVRAVLIRSASERAFSTGADVVRIHRSRHRLEAYSFPYYRLAYTGNARLFHFPKPFVALIDGIVMGGGVGLSVHGSHRVVSENLVLAMPETGIGLFADVGTSHVLPRAPGERGMYLALSGARIGAADAIHAGLADTYVPSARFAALEAKLAAADLSGDAHAAVSRALETFAENPGRSALEQHRAAIERCFAAHSVEEMIEALAAESSDWAAATAALLAQKSPTSLKLTCRLMREGAGLDFDDCMRLEYRLVRRCLAREDYYEGVRAAVIDKDGAPEWRPATLAEVRERDVAAHFEPLGTGELGFDWEPDLK